MSGKYLTITPEEIIKRLKLTKTTTIIGNSFANAIPVYELFPGIMLAFDCDSLGDKKPGIVLAYNERRKVYQHLPQSFFETATLGTIAAVVI